MVGSPSFEKGLHRQEVSLSFAMAWIALPAKQGDREEYQKWVKPMLKSFRRQGDQCSCKHSICCFQGAQNDYRTNRLSLGDVTVSIMLHIVAASWPFIPAQR